MKKIFIVSQFLFLAVLSAVVLYYIFKPVEKPDYKREEWQSWKGFYTLSYQGISKKEGAEYVSAKRLGQHLKALRRAGFHTIAPEDVTAFLAGKRPLPEKAILLLFEGGRKDSLIYATPYLRENRFIGVMCVPTKLTDRWENFYLDNGELKSLSREPNWRLCSMGHRAIDTIPVDGQGAKGHFLTSFMWTAEGRENRESFAERVQKDYTVSAKILEKAAGGPVDAYLYPFSDRGTIAGTQSFPAIVNLASLKKYHKIAFTGADNPFNTRQSNPYDLNRLRVSLQWDAGRLLKELAKYAPREKQLEGPLSPDDWIMAGDVKIHQKNLRVAPAAVSWLRGSEDWRNVDMKVAVNLSGNATAFLYGRYVSPHSYVRLSINGTGVRFQERMGTMIQTLVAYPSAIDTTKTHMLGLRIKGNRVWATLDDHSPSGPFPLTAATNRGRVGFGSQDGHADFTEPQIRQIPSYLVFAENVTGISQATEDKAGVILPVWFRGETNPDLSQIRIKELLIASSKGISTIPVIEAPNGFSGEKNAQIFIERVIKALENPLVKPLVKRIAVRCADERLLSVIRSKGYGIIRILSVGEVMGFVNDAGKINNDDMVLIDGKNNNTMSTLTQLLRVVPADRIFASVNEETGRTLGVGVVVDSAQR